MARSPEQSGQYSSLKTHMIPFEHIVVEQRDELSVYHAIQVFGSLDRPDIGSVEPPGRFPD